MNDFLDSAGTLGIAPAVITTLAAMLTIGIAFLVKPGAPTLWWSCAFTLAMVATYGIVAGDVTGAEELRRASLGALMGAPALLWSGFRAAWQLRAFAWAGPVMAAVCAAMLVLVDDRAWFTVAYRTVFFAASLFAALLVVDWARAATRRHARLLLPLAIVSIAFAVLGAGTFVAGVFFPPSGGDDFELVRLISSMGMLVYVACALIAVLGFTLRDSGLGRSTGVSSSWQQFERIAGERLQRAERTADPWSVVYVQIDDAADIRQSAGSTALANLSERLEAEVRDVFPAEADVASPSTGAVVVLVPRGETVVRDLLHAALERVTALDVDGALPIRPTASAGWAPTAVLGYDLDTLVYTGREAARVASEKGGDRWERVSAAIVESLIDQSELR